MQVTGFYLPGTTDPEPWPDALVHLMRRNVDHVDGGADLMFAFVSMAEPELALVGPRSPTEPGDLRNRVIASCLKHNCMSAIQWVVERREWTASCGIWNEQLGVATLDAPRLRDTPYVWLSTNVDLFREHYRLQRF